MHFAVTAFDLEAEIRSLRARSAAAGLKSDGQCAPEAGMRRRDVHDRREVHDRG
jgi:hypothetical protein